MLKKTLFVSIGLLSLLAGGIAFGTSHSVVATDELNTETFAVTGMTCGGCEVGVRMAVGKLSGIEKVTASYQDGKAVVTYDPSKVTPEDIIGAIKKLGNEAKLEKQGPSDSQ